MNLNNRQFKTKENHRGLSSDETLFHYYQVGDLITGIYSGGKIKSGHIIGKQIAEDSIEILYQCITTEGQLMAGESKGVITKTADDLLEIKFDWQWLNGDKSGGRSHYIEIK